VYTAEETLDNLAMNDASLVVGSSL
jgi:hypothetical protein